MTRFTLVATFLVVFVAVSARADLGWRERASEARYEGLRDELISGQNFELLGVQRVPSASRCAEGWVGSTPSENLYLLIPESTSGELQAEVRELPSNYMMRPKGPIGRSFRWNASEVIGPAGIDIRRLSVLVWPDGKKIYYPARLSLDAKEHDAPAYRFTFDVKGQWSLTWTVQDASSSARIADGKARGGKGLAHVCWDGLDAAGRPPSAGPHMLRGKLKVRTSRSLEHDLYVRFVVLADVEE